jgi:hypothetical protein
MILRRLIAWFGFGRLQPPPAVPKAAGDRMLHGAACHGCLLISETSCEARNVLLDRVLLVDTVGPMGAAYF